jgi:phosphoribosyl-AMP cyclohydrolase / phosphoribosyl-ATP pyrophosphohydrolase
MKQIIDQIDWKKCQNLLPVIVQDSSSNEVLMMAFMNPEALELSLSTKFAHYYSRTKERLWKKGESSGHTQKIESFNLDCDNDTLLIKVIQEGVACHTGRKSCFFTNLETGDATSDVEVDTTAMYGVIDQLFHTIMEKKNHDPEKSYTASLISKGENSYLKKIVEEAGEFCFAIKDNNKEEIVYEAADMVYHTMVAMADKGISPDLVKKELARRFDIGGLEEKASRTK